MLMMETVGFRPAKYQVLKLKLEELGKTQAWLSKKIRVDVATLSRFFSGQLNLDNPKVQKIEQKIEKRIFKELKKLKSEVRDGM